MTRIESESGDSNTIVVSSAKSNKNKNNTWENVIDIVEDISPKRSAKEAVELARNAFRSGKTLPLKFRKSQLKGLLRFLENEKDKIEEALYKVSTLKNTFV